MIQFEYWTHYYTERKHISTERSIFEYFRERLYIKRRFERRQQERKEKMKRNKKDAWVKRITVEKCDGI